jgi:5S rRNA maturation endonuclease (ribonuclease M5)
MIPSEQIDRARAVRLEDEISRRGITLRGRNGSLEGPCPVCGGTDRFAVNTKKPAFNCRVCGIKGGDAIALTMALDGCDFKQAVEMLTEPVTPNGHAEPAQTAKRIVVARFDYHDTQGAVVYQTERVEFRNPDGSYVLKDGKHEKKFLLRRPDPDRPGEWISGRGCMAGVTRFPYRLPELIEALANGHVVVIVEGEAKADLLWKWGIPATCNSEGHGSAKNWADHAKYFKAADQIIVLPDNDQPGRDHANTVAANLSERGAAIRVLDLPGLGAKGDVIDWVRAGGTVEQLHALIKREARKWEPPSDHGAEAKPTNGATQGNAPKPASRVIGAGTFMRSYEAISYTIDGVLPSGCLYGLTAKPGTGKTAGMIAATLAVETGREDILGCAVECGRVAYVTIENPVDFKMKLAVNCYFHNISFDEIEPRVAIIDGRDTPEQIYEGLRLDAEAHGGFQLVNFDTFQAGFAVANAGAFNDNEAVLKYVQRLRPLTVLPGLPSVLVAFHPTKNALETELIPYGGGATYGEIDGNLTLWKEASIKFHWNRVRGPEFEPRFFRIEKLSCPDILDKQGRQILLPVMRPITEMDAAEREKNEGNLDLAMLRAMSANPDGTQLEWALAVGIRSKGTISKKLQKLKIQKLTEQSLAGKWRLTPKGQKEAEQ